MRRIVIVGLSVAALVSLSFIHPFGNPRAEPAEELGTLLQGTTVPAEARAVLTSKCADCHSNATRWPLYSRLAPGSWLIERDVARGREEMNLSHWRALSSDQQQVFAAKIIAEVRGEHMPPWQYRLLHRHADMSPRDMQAIGSLALRRISIVAASGGAGNAARGEVVFNKLCSGCHALNANREGPRLGDVYGRRAGSVSGFSYSAGLKNLGITWNDVTLDRWLADPDVMVKDNNMSFAVSNAQQRQDLIAYLKRR